MSDVNSQYFLTASAASTGRAETGRRRFARTGGRVATTSLNSGMQPWWGGLNESLTDMFEARAMTQRDRRRLHAAVGGLSQAPAEYTLRGMVAVTPLAS